MSVRHEQMIADNVPQADQLKRLAAVGVGSAAARQKLKTLSRSSRAHYFVDEVDFLAEASRQDTEPQEIRHRMAGRVGVRAASDGVSKLWSLKYYDTYWVHTRLNGWRAARTLYRFEWDRSRTLLAERTLRIVDGSQRDEASLADCADSFRFRDDEAAMWHVQQEIELVSADDCEELIHDAKAYFSIVEQGGADLVVHIFVRIFWRCIESMFGLRLALGCGGVSSV